MVFYFLPLFGIFSPASPNPGPGLWAWPSSSPPPTFLKHESAALITSKIRNLLNGLLPVSYPEERNGDLNTSQDYIENEAVRAANIAKAEISAARVKEKLDAMNETERASYQNNHAKLAALFWTEQSLHEDPGHDGNVKTTLEIDQRYGTSHFEHGLQILGITGKELMDASPYKEARDNAPADRAKRAEKSQASGKAGGEVTPTSAFTAAAHTPCGGLNIPHPPRLCHLQIT